MNCRSEVDLLAYQFRAACDDVKGPEHFIVLCEPCKVKRKESDIEAEPDDWIISFGQYKGRRISEIPISYLDWLIGQHWLRPGLKKKVEKYLEGCAEWKRM